MVDKAALFTEITERNRLRREAQLPLLDVRAELEHAMAVAALDEYNAFCDQHQDKLQAFRDEVLSEHRAKNPEFGATRMGMWMVGTVALRRFEAWIKQTYGVTKPQFLPRHAIIYGQGRKS
jgi:hypothetical protein